MTTREEIERVERVNVNGSWYVYDPATDEDWRCEDVIGKLSLEDISFRIALSRLSQVEFELAHAREEREAVALDAERWRYMRDLLEIRNQTAMDGQRHPFLSLRIAAGRKFDWQIPEGTYYVRGNALDAEIDRALAARAGKEGR